jgi:predicted nucleotidyltransferase component of viral defense system
MRLPLQHVECFHLLLLRMLESRLDRSRWVVKGGVNLRAWFGSLRYSEDLGLDVLGGGAHSLREKLDRLLAATTFRDLLRAQGLALARISQPKQTETTQRWKFELEAEGAAAPLHTRVEFSRRGRKAEEYQLDAVRPEVVRQYAIVAPTANHYTARSAVRQKIAALASRSETQARDVWDLEHLLRTTAVEPGPFTGPERKSVAVALDRAVGMPFEVYRSQVVPYLEAEHQELYGTPAVWERMRELVVDRLSEHSA